MPKYRCFCTNCGWRDKSEKLTFNISKLLITKAIEVVDTVDLEDSRRTGLSLSDSIKDMLSNSTQQYYLSIEDIAKGTKDENLQLPTLLCETFANQIMRSFKEQIGLDDKVVKDYVAKLQSQLSNPISCRLIGHSDNKDCVIVAASIGDHYHQIRYCPKCHAMVSSMAGVYPEITVSVLGGKRASKTTTLVATLYKFSRSLDGFKVTFEDNKEITAQWSVNEKLLDNYENNTAFEPTSHESGDSRHKRVNFVRGSFLITTPKKVLLSFIDIPGEFIDNFAEGADAETVNDFIREYTPIYQNLDFLWICIDEPVLLQNSLSRGKLTDDFLKKYGYSVGDEVIQPKSVGTIYQSLARLQENLRSIKGVALIWGKIDQLGRCNRASDNPPPFDNMGGYSDTQTSMKYNRYQQPILISEYVLKRSEHVKSQIIMRQDENGNRVWDHGEFVKDISSLFKGRVCCFATSNYGHTPNTNEMTISPINTELPLLWTLAMAGMLLVDDDFSRPCGKKKKRSAR